MEKNELYNTEIFNSLSKKPKNVMSGYKECYRCKRSLRSTKKNFHKNKIKKDGLSIYCKKCRREKNNISRKKNYKKNSLKDYKYNIKRLYGITYEVYLELLEKQNKRCGICGLTLEEADFNNGRGKTKHFHIDHDHKTKKVRGLLCNKCNHGLGNYRENPFLLIKAIKYLKENK